MIIEFSVDKEDFLTHQLYVASTSERIIKKRRTNQILIPLIYVAFGSLLLIEQKYFYAIGLLVFAVLWFAFYPKYERNRYRKHYRNFIEENYQERIGSNGTLEIQDEVLIAKDRGGESRVFTSEISEIVSLSSLFLVRLKSGQSIILPKRKLSNLDTVTNELREFADKLSISFVNREDWEWK